MDKIDKESIKWLVSLSEQALSNLKAAMAAFMETRNGQPTHMNLRIEGIGEGQFLELGRENESYVKWAIEKEKEFVNDKNRLTWLKEND